MPSPVFRYNSSPDAFLHSSMSRVPEARAGHFSFDVYVQWPDWVCAEILSGYLWMEPDAPAVPAASPAHAQALPAPAAPPAVGNALHDHYTPPTDPRVRRPVVRDPAKRAASRIRRSTRIASANPRRSRRLSRKLGN